MSVQNTSRNVVIVANQFNPSIISQIWLVKNGILLEDDFDEGCFFLPMVVQIFSKEFNLLVMPEQLQFAPKQETYEQEIIKAKLGKIIEKLPHTPFSAIGLNFTWQIKPDKEGIDSLTRNIFYRDEPLFRKFDTPDARYGGYFSKNVFGCRLKLDIKPLIVKTQDELDERLQFAFNFHKDLNNDDKIADIFGLLDTWNEAKKLAEDILNTVVIEKEQ